MSWLAVRAPGVEAMLERPFVPEAIELAFALALLTLTGLVAGNVIGRLFGGMVNGLMTKIPIASVV
jgi:uncharacterized membrane protein